MKRHRVFWALMVSLLGVVWAQRPCGAQDLSDISAQIEALKDQNQSLQTRLQALEDKLNSPGASPAVSSPAAGDEESGEAGLHDTFTPMEGGNEYFSDESRHLTFSDASGNSVFKIGGYLFSDLDVFSQPNSQYLLNDAGKTAQKDFNGFLARKAHLDFAGYFDKLVGMSIGIESDKSTAVSWGIFHAYVYVKLDKALVLTAGKFSNILSLEGIQPSADLPFMEASMVADLVPNKDIGAMVSGEVGHLFDYGLEISNGEQDNESSATGPGKATQNIKALTARVFFEPFKKSEDDGLKGLGFGVAASLDNEVAGDPAIWASNQTSLGGNAFLVYNGATPQGDFYHWDPQFYYYNGPFGLQGEMVQSIQTVGTGGSPAVQLTNTAWLLESNWVFGGKASYEGALVDDPIDPSQGKWGALELVARIHQFYADVNSFTVGFPYALNSPLATGAQEATAFGVGANWWLDSHFKTMADFERTTFSGGNQTIHPEQVFFMRAALIL
jgi:phosphate-selective porin OprO/OprP